MSSVAVVAPVFDEEACVDVFCDRVIAAVAPIDPDFQLVLVDDGSRDGTWARVAARAAGDPRVRGVRLARNFGQSRAVTCGLHEADAEHVVVLDSDLQDRPEEIPRLHAAALEGPFDLVLARKRRRRQPLFQRALTALFYWLFNLVVDEPYDPGVGNFRLMSRRCRDYVLSRRERVWIFTLAGWAGFPSTTVDVEHDARFAGRTSYQFGRRVQMALDALLLHSDRAFWVSLGLGIALVAFAAAATAVTAFIAPAELLAGPGILLAIAGVGGLLLAHLGVLGIYVSRLTDEVRRPPLFVVAERTWSQTPTSAGAEPDA